MYKTLQISPWTHAGNFVTRLMSSKMFPSKISSIFSQLPKHSTVSKNDALKIISNIFTYEKDELDGTHIEKKTTVFP